MPKLLIRIDPSKTIQELQQKFVTQQAAALVPKLTQAEAQDLAFTYQTLFGGVWDVVPQAGKWVAQRRAGT